MISIRGFQLNWIHNWNCMHSSLKIAANDMAQLPIIIALRFLLQFDAGNSAFHSTPYVRLLYLCLH